MDFHKESLEQIDNDTRNKHYERVNVIPRNRSYDFDMVTLKKLALSDHRSSFKDQIRPKKATFMNT